MAKNRTQKKTEIDSYVAKIQAANAMYFVKPIALSATQSSKLKMGLIDSNATFNVVKNTLFLNAIKTSGMSINDIKDVFVSGEHAVLFANGDVTAPAKYLKQFILEEKDKVEVLSGYFAGKFISKADVQEMADLPDFNTMMARTLATMNGVTTNFVRASANNIERLLTVLEAISAKAA